MRKLTVILLTVLVVLGGALVGQKGWQKYQLHKKNDTIILGMAREILRPPLIKRDIATGDVYLQHGPIEWEFPQLCGPTKQL